MDEKQSEKANYQGTDYQAFLSLNDAYKSKELMRILITLTLQWEISREIEMTQVLLYSETRRRKEAKAFLMQS